MSGNHTLQLPETDDIAALLAEVMPRSEPPPIVDNDDIFAAFSDAPPPSAGPASVRTPRSQTSTVATPAALNGDTLNQTLAGFFKQVNWTNQERAVAPAKGRREIETPIELLLTQLSFAKFCLSINWRNHPDAPPLNPESIRDLSEDMFGGFVDDRTGGKPGADWLISNVMNEFVWD